MKITEEKVSEIKDRSTKLSSQRWKEGRGEGGGNKGGREGGRKTERSGGKKRKLEDRNSGTWKAISRHGAEKNMSRNHGQNISMFGRSQIYRLKKPIKT